MDTTREQQRKTRNPLVSIITPSLNQGRFIERTLLSVLNQTYRNIEYIVMDGGSTDNTKNILDKYSSDPRLSWFSGCDSGQYDAVNRGFTRARGDIVGWINADDVYTEHAVEKAVHVFQVEPSADIVYGRLYSLVEQGAYTRILYTRPFSYHWLRRYCFTNPSATFVRAPLIHQEKYLIDTAVPTLGDWDWFLRMAEAGKRFHYLPEIVAGFRVHPASRTMRMDKRTIRRERRMIERRHNIALRYMNLWVDTIIPWCERFQNVQVLIRNRAWREIVRRMCSATSFILMYARKKIV
jgi:glycosyltransferase involved in cell wall biosynthesis